MVVKKYGDIISGLVIFLFTAVYFFDIRNIKIIDSNSVDAAFVPKLVAYTLFILSAIIIINGVLKLKKDSKANEHENANEKVAWIPVILTVLLLILYVAAFEKVGFIITTIFYLFLQFMVLSPKRNIKKVIQYGILAVIGAFLLQYIFVNLLYVMLPEGLFR